MATLFNVIFFFSFVDKLINQSGVDMNCCNLHLIRLSAAILHTYNLNGKNACVRVFVAYAKEYEDR